MPSGRGIGFRGGLPPWPYIGRGRGGLPRCRYPGARVLPDYWKDVYKGQVSYPAYSVPWGMPYYGAIDAPGPVPLASQMTRERELDFLKEQANDIKRQLEQIDVRMHELETEKG